MLDIEYIRHTIEKYKVPNSGTVSASEAYFISSLIDKIKPDCFVELGVASGLSTGLIIKALESSVPNSTLISLDLMEKYFGDKEKDVGFLVAEMCESISCNYELHKGIWAADLPNILNGRMVDMIFIDANHQHPWPTLDTMLILPLLSDNSYVIYHDVELYTKQKDQRGIGPHYIFEGITAEKNLVEGTYRNIGAIKHKSDYKKYEKDLIDTLKLDWTLTSGISREITDRICEFSNNYYSDGFVSELKNVFLKNSM